MVRLGIAMIGVLFFQASISQAQADDWSGFSFGAYTGIGLSHNSARSVTFNESSFGSAQSISGDDAEWNGGFAISASWQMQSTVLGVAIDFDPFGTTQQIECRLSWAAGWDSNVFVSDEGLGSCARDVSWSASIVGKLGWLASDSTLLYGLGGWTTSRIRQSFEWPSSLDSSSQTLSGVTVGGGVEHRLTANWHLSVEFRATMFEAKSVSGVSKELNAPQFTEIGGDVETVRFGLTYFVPWR
ncbi:outer membrane protein [Hyphomicrobium sp.]|uniref:outer membrane protein n=1 Tax=Hyphomicrobium sp. TaxID=82 RepID=UPI002D7A33CE|nr:outer membrane beta-barrel protein [Hyphomicrobium sp.]HET6388254.1 outer membrane beta-barrel protein [Hyphomicrobium sp.]